MDNAANVNLNVNKLNCKIIWKGKIQLCFVVYYYNFLY